MSSTTVPGLDPVPINYSDELADNHRMSADRRSRSTNEHENLLHVAVALLSSYQEAASTWRCPRHPTYHVRRAQRVPVFKPCTKLLDPACPWQPLPFAFRLTERDGN